MAEGGEEEGEGKLPCVDHGPLNEGAVGKTLVQATVHPCLRPACLRLTLVSVKVDTLFQL